MRSNFTIAAIELVNKDGSPLETAKGKPYIRVKMEPGGWTSLFRGGDIAYAKEHAGEMVSGEIEKNGQYTNVTDLGEPETSAAASGSPGPVDWDAKEDRQRCGIFFSVHLKQMFEWQKLGVESQDPTKQVFQSYADLVNAARRAAVSDLDWIRNYATGEVPFEKESE